MTDETQNPSPEEEAPNTVQSDDQPAIDEVEEESGTSETGEDAAADEAKQKRRTVKDRINELTANWRNTERDRDEWRRLAQQLMEAQGKPKEQAPEPPKETVKPTSDQFEDYESYLEALADWKADQKFKEFSKQREKEQQQNTQQQRVQQFQARAQEFAKDKPDFQTVVSNPNVAISEPMMEAIVESDMGPAVAYHLGKNPDEAARIAHLSAYGAAREIGRIEANLSIPTKPRTSQAPDPIEPVGGGGEKATKDPDKMSVDEWMAQRNKQVFQR